MLAGCGTGPIICTTITALEPTTTLRIHWKSRCSSEQKKNGVSDVVFDRIILQTSPPRRSSLRRRADQRAAPSVRELQIHGGVDLEKAASGPAGGVSFSGVSSRGGELITIDYRGFGVPDADAAISTTPTQSFIHLNLNAIFEIRIDGCSVSD